MRLLYVSLLKEGYYFSDFRTYEGAALSLLHGQGFGSDYARPPLYPLFLALNYGLFGQHFFTVRIIQALLGGFASVLICLLGYRLLNAHAGLAAGWISVFYPYYVFLSGLLYPTLISALLLMGTLLFLLQGAERKTRRYFALAGLCLGLSALATPASLAFVPFLGFWVLFFIDLPATRRLTLFAVNALAVLLCLVPWTLYYYQQHGQIILVDARAESHLSAAAPRETEPATADVESSNSQWQAISSHPGRFLVNYGKEFLHFWSFIPDRVVTRDPEYRQQRHQEDARLIVDQPFTSPWLDYLSIFTYGPVFLFALLGLVIQAGYRRTLILPFFLLISQALGYSLFFTQVRYRLPVEFCLMIFAGGGFMVLWQKVRNPKPAQAKESWLFI